MEESLCAQIKLVNELHDKDILGKILIKMQPLIKKYIRKLYFMEKEDAFQELNLALIEAIYHLKTYKNDAMCLTYLQKSIINKYNYLCKLNIKFDKQINTFKEITDDIPYNENFSDIEFNIDLYNLLKKNDYRQKCIIKYIIFNNFSDKEISLILGVSRQYINRVKKKIFKEIFYI